MKLYNVGYGANIIELDGKIYIFDAGDDNIGKRTLLPFLADRYRGLKDIEAIFLSHYHYNHIEGVPHLINRYNVKHIYTNGTYSDDQNEPYINRDTPATEEIERLVNEKNIPYTFYEEGDVLKSDDVTFRFLSPLKHYATKGGFTTDPNGKTSGVLRVEYGDFVAVFGGDLDRGDIFTEIWNVTGLAKTNVFFWPHHGASRLLEKGNAVDPMDLDLAVVETIRTSPGTIGYLEENGIEYLWMRNHRLSGLQAHKDGSYKLLTPTGEEALRPKGKIFL